MKLFPTEAAKEAFNTFAKMNSITEEFVQRRVQKGSKDENTTGASQGTKKDFLDLLINATDPETQQQLTPPEVQFCLPSFLHSYKVPIAFWIDLGSKQFVSVRRV